MKVKRADRERAKYAFMCVKDLNDGVKKSEYKSYVKSFPMMILQNGFGNAIAFAYSKSKDKKGEHTSWAWVLWHLRCWLEGDTDSSNGLNSFDNKIKTFIENRILKTDSSTYRKLEKEAVALLNWLRRFAEGMIVEKDNSGGEND